MSTVLELADVTVRRGHVTLLDSVNWIVHDDERWVILGPNGAGKTTLVQLCSAQIHPTSGVAGILGEVLGTIDVFDLHDGRSLVSYSTDADPDPVALVIGGATGNALKELKRQLESEDS